MTRDEWIARFLARYRALAEDVISKQVELYGSSGLARERPETAAEAKAEQDWEE